MAKASTLTSVADALAAPSIMIADREALLLADEHFGIAGKITRLATEKDDTFRIKCPNGGSYILKIANGAENPLEISFQIDLLRHIAAKDPTLPIPQVIADRKGNLQFSFTDQSNQSRQVHLLTYLEGVPLSEVQTTARQREKVGEVLGKLRLAMADYSHPADTREIAWDVIHLMKLRPLLGEIEDPVKRNMLELGLERFAQILERLKKCRSQVVHNDFSQSNVVVSTLHACFVSGVIDFGDAVRTAVAIDVSTALLNQLPSEESHDFFGHAHDVLRGYLSVADLSDEELALLPHLVTGRIIARALLTTWRGRLFPNNAKYILRNTEQGWHQLQWLVTRPIDGLSDDFISTAGR